MTTSYAVRSPIFDELAFPRPAATLPATALTARADTAVLPALPSAPATPVSPPVPPLRPATGTLPTPLPVTAVKRTPLPDRERSGVHLLTRADLDIVSEMGGRAARLVLRLLAEDRAALG